MAADLEEVLAIETARSGQATGEVTTVLRTLPERARRRLPLRLRNPWRLALAVAIVGLIVAGAIVLAANRTHSGISPATNVRPPAATQPVTLQQNAAHDYNPFGTSAEHPELAANATDNQPGTSWSTFHYQGNTLGKPGTGLYLDAAPKVVARGLAIQTSTPGFRVEIWVSNQFRQLPQGDQTPLEQRGWTRLASSGSVRSRETFTLDTAGNAYRYYLVWIVGLPPGSQNVQLDEVTLFK